MKCKVKSTFSMGMKTFLAGTEHEFPEKDVPRLSQYLDIPTSIDNNTPSPDDSAKKEEVKKENSQTEKGLEKPKKDKMMKKSKTKGK